MESAPREEAESPLRLAVSLKPDAPLLRLLLEPGPGLGGQPRQARRRDLVNFNRSLVVESDNATSSGSTSSGL